MTSPARKVIPIHTNEPSRLQTGNVVSVLPKEMKIQINTETITAQKAFSCLIDPEPGDRVLCAEVENGLRVVLSIIDRPGNRKMSVSFPFDAQIRANNGSLHIASSDHVTIASDGLNFFSKKAIHKSREAIVSYENVTASGNTLQAGFKTVSLISNLINTMAKQVFDKFKGYVRCTEDNDMVKAGRLSRHTDGVYSMDSKHTMMKSQKTTVIDGEKILMG